MFPEYYRLYIKPQIIIFQTVATGDLSSLKIATSTSAGLAQGVVLATTGSAVHGSGDQIAEEASRKREIRLMKNRYEMWFQLFH